MGPEENLIITNGKIFTCDADNPYAESMIIENGCVKWIGRVKDRPACPYPERDLGARRVLPGFIDAHMHPVMLADMSRQISCLPPSVHSIEDMIGAIKSKRQNQEPGQWILGWGYDEGKLAEHRAPSRYDLDRGCCDSPVCMVRTCLHIRCVNSKALELAGINRDTPDPPGGVIERDEEGEPTGILRESARELVNRILPEKTEEDIVSDLEDLGKLLASQGITAICDMGNLGPGDHFHAYEKAASMGFSQKVAMYYMWEHFADNPDFHFPREYMKKDRQIRLAGLKLIGDGSVSGKTAWMRQPYPGTEEYGMSVCSRRLLESALAFCKAHQCQLAVHAMGERAIDWITEAISREQKWNQGREPHLRIEHGTDPSEQALEIASKCGFGIATQPVFLYSEIESYLNNLGTERTKELYPVKHVLEKGVKLCFSTDAPATAWAEPSNPFVSIKGAVTRRAWDGTDCGQKQRVDLETAIALYSRESAGIAGFETIGQLKEGFCADFVVLDQDIFELPPEELDQVKAAETYINGKRVY